jgi:hypothetical protein
MERNALPEVAVSRTDRILARLATGQESRIAVPASDDELRRLEGALGFPLPSGLRALLSRIGAGLYEHGHEVFGPARVMIHDIELVPDLLSVRARLGAADGMPRDAVPFHRGSRGIHFIRTAGPHAGEVLSASGGTTYPDLGTFVEAVLLAPPA